MYVIREGLSPKLKFLAVLFSIFGMFGALPVVNVNQLKQALNDKKFRRESNHFTSVCNSRIQRKSFCTRDQIELLNMKIQATKLQFSC